MTAPRSIPTRSARRRSGGLRRGVAVLAVLGLVGALAACGGPDDDPVDIPDGAPADDIDDIDDIDLGELDDLDLTDEELAEVEELLGGTGEGFAEVIVDGEPLEVRSVSCGVIPGGEQVRLEANVEPGFSYFQIRFGEDWSSDEREYDFDDADSATLWIDRDEFAVEFSSFGGVGDVVAWGDERHATGTAILVPQGERSEAENPDPQFVEFTIACDDGVSIRPRPDGVVDLVPPGEDDDEDEAIDDVVLLDPDGGWTTGHLAVDVPDEPGTGIAVVDGERVELLVQCQGGPEADGPDDGQVFRFDLFAADVTQSTIGLEVRRTVGSGEFGQRFAEQERVYVFTADGGVGAIGRNVTLDGEPEEPRRYPLADAQLVHVDPDGVVTMRTEVTEPLQGQFDPVTLEVGARCDDVWSG